MNRAYLLTGGNLGDPEATLKHALTRIHAGFGQVIRLSALYKTAAWGKTDQPDFLNQALLLHTDLSARELLESLLDLEKQIGRVRKEKFGARLIDIDILLFNQEIIDSPSLSVPHPALPFRRFALSPLAEIAPDLIHPVSGKTIAQLLQECPDELPVKKLISPPYKAE